ncbi:MAG: thiamine phosphate synthase [Deltaproteobacteria bacterium]|nr:thiamine phosphate synthase [Deltaproteobacteria bacterium]
MGKDAIKIRGLYAFIDAAYVDLSGAGDAAAGLLSGGARIVQLRAKDVAPRDILVAARAVREATERSGALFIVNDRADIAMIAGADGVHLGQDDPDVEEVRGLLGPEGIIGLSTHDVKEAVEAETLGADYISLGPIFPTRTKKDAQTPRGLTMLSEVRSAVRLPIVAIGGITRENMEEVFKAGADSVAIISGILMERDIKARVASIVSMIDRPGAY